MQVLREFKLPEGATAEDMDANGDGEVLAVLDLGTDDSLVEAGLAREVVNRVQKLRKKAGLVATDVVDVFLDAKTRSTGAPFCRFGLLLQCCWVVAGAMYVHFVCSPWILLSEVYCSVTIAVDCKPIRCGTVELL